jgi:hypothetical protein
MPASSDVRRGLVRSTGYIVGLAGLCLLAGCRFPTTIYGRLVLKPGDDGDVRLARVELHDSVAWDSAPVYTIVPEPVGQFFQSPFEFPVVAPGPYYLLAWQDRDADGRVSDGDLTGIYRDSMESDFPGKPLMVYDGWTVDAGDIEMAMYELLEVNAAGVRSQSGDTTTFTYAFNHDVYLNSLAVAFPGQPSLPDPGAPGTKAADSTYRSESWHWGGPMPSGLHQLEFRGVFRDSGFAFRVAVMVE